METGGSRVLPRTLDGRLLTGYAMLAAGGDFDIDDHSMPHRIDWRPAPDDVCPVKAAMVDSILAERRRRCAI